MADINAMESSKDDQDDGRNRVVENTDEEKNDDGGVNPMTVIHLVYVMPFFLKLSSTIPPLYLSVALINHFEAPGYIAGIVMAMFQGARAAVIGITMYSPEVSICCGSVFGVLGFICLAFYPTWEDKTYALALFSAANIFTGLTNAFSALQMFAKREYSKDMKGLRFALRRQSVMSGAACVVSYFSSGIIYHELGLAWIGILGCLCVGVASVSLVLYLVGRKPRVIEEEEKEDCSSELKNDASRLPLVIEEEENEDCSMELKNDASRFRTSRLNFHLLNLMNSNKDLATENQEQVLNGFSGAEEVVLNEIVLVVAAAFLIEALTSGSLFAVGPLYIQEAFDKSTSYTGSVFGIASVFGTVFTTLFISDKGKEIVRKILPSASEIYVMMLVISVFTLALNIQSFPVQVVSIIFVIGFNETLWALLTELEGSITTEKFYRKVGPGALLLHKVINIAVSFVCPILIEIRTWLPYTLTGGIALVFSIFFALRLEIQRHRNTKLIAEVVADERLTAAQAMSFTTLETVSRMASVYKKRDYKKERMNFDQPDGIKE